MRFHMRSTELLDDEAVCAKVVVWTAMTGDTSSVCGDY
jgi:hypothetical protein